MLKADIKWHKGGANLLLVLQCMLGRLQAVFQVSFLCSLGCLCRQQHLCLCLQLKKDRRTKKNVIPFSKSV